MPDAKLLINPQGEGTQLYSMESNVKAKQGQKIEMIHKLHRVANIFLIAIFPYFPLTFP